MRFSPFALAAAALVATIALTTAGCDTSQKTAKTAAATSAAEPLKKVTMPEIEVTAAKPTKPDAPKVYKAATYNPSAKRMNDLLHTNLNVRFDWEKAQLFGKATLRLKPYFYPTDKLILDAKGFEVKSVEMVTSLGKAPKNVPLKYDYDGTQLLITLDRVYQSTESYEVLIDYIAKPNERKVGGSNAISQDKGLYFINPKGEDKSKPRQIWTQGETESNSGWFPTIDKPNERATDEIYMTVEDKYQTLSNGILENSKKNADGTRTDHWVMDLPHAPYLVMMAVGEFSVVTEKWRGKDIMYMVEPAYAKDAKDIYPHVPEILDFYSDRLGVEYPWQKLAHICVREYVSGAMENTTAIIYGDFCQRHRRDLMDSPNDYIVAHEMFHHWFGDYVTCESWSNLTVNESFANYSETLWMEHKYSKDEGDAHLNEDLQGYLGQAASGRQHNLVNFDYKDREDMFDGISYNKGGCILHQLRNYLGDDAFFASLKEYLTTNKFNTGEAHQLRLAFEKTTGEDLNWYWNQWYYAAGHPQLTLDYGYNETDHKATVTIRQTQDGEKFPAIFELPLDVDVYVGGKATRERIRMTQREQTFEFAAATKPDLVNVDATKSLVGTKKDNHTDAEWLYMFYHAPLYLDRAEAMEALHDKTSNADVAKLYRDALTDRYWGIRKDAIQAADVKTPEVAAVVAKLAKIDPQAKVRSAAMVRLTEAKNTEYTAIAKAAIENPEESYGVVGAALEHLQIADSVAAIKYAKKLENEESLSLLAAVGKIYAATGDLSYRSFFEERWGKLEGRSSIQFFADYGMLHLKAPAAEQLVAAGKLEAIGTDMNQAIWARLGATKAIKDLKNAAEAAKNTAQIEALGKIIENIKAKETSKRLKAFYSKF